MARALTIHGFHGTSNLAAAAILERGFHLSRNRWDLLGDGVYFWQDAPARAWEWAEARHGDDAAVIHSLIRLDDCIDLLDTRWEQPLRDGYEALRLLHRQAHRSLPRQTPESLAHPLDRLVVNLTVHRLARDAMPIRTARAAFREGAPIYPDSHLFNRSHVQVAVRDPALILRSLRARRP